MVGFIDVWVYMIWWFLSHGTLFHAKAFTSLSKKVMLPAYIVVTISLVQEFLTSVRMSDLMNALIGNDWMRFGEFTLLYNVTEMTFHAPSHKKPGLPNFNLFLSRRKPLYCFLMEHLINKTFRLLILKVESSYIRMIICL